MKRSRGPMEEVAFGMLSLRCPQGIQMSRSSKLDVQILTSEEKYELEILI